MSHHLPPIRPRFDVPLPFGRDEAIGRLRDSLAAAGGRFGGAVAGHHVDVTLPADERRIWSPHLQLEFRDKDGGLVMHGLLAPMPGPWTAYALTLLASVTIAAFAGCFAVVQWMLERPPYALIPAGLAAAGAVGLYRLSIAGQRASRGEMVRLRRFALEAVGIDPLAVDQRADAAVDA